MNEIEQAIEYFERNEVIIPDCRCQDCEVRRTILTALRAEAEREKGCEWCTPEPNEMIELSCTRIGRTVHKDHETAGRIESSPLFCPKCGKKRLEGKQG